jgi:hypothetical protein
MGINLVVFQRKKMCLAIKNSIVITNALRSVKGYASYNLSNFINSNIRRYPLHTFKYIKKDRKKWSY